MMLSHDKSYKILHDIYQGCMYKIYQEAVFTAQLQNEFLCVAFYANSMRISMRASTRFDLIGSQNVL